MRVGDRHKLHAWSFFFLALISIQWLIFLAESPKVWVRLLNQCSVLPATFTLKTLGNHAAGMQGLSYIEEEGAFPALRFLTALERRQ